MRTALNPATRLFPVTAGACLLFTKQVCGYCIPSLSGTVGMCVWPGWGEGTLNKQPMVPVSAKAHRPPLPRQRLLAGPCDKEPAEFI